PPILTAGPIDIEETPVTRQSARADAEHEAPLGDVIEVRDAARQLGRMMIGQQMRARRELHLRGAEQRLRDEQIGRGIRLPWRGEMLADPGLAKTEAVAQFEMFEVPFEALAQPAFRRMRRHHEYA